MNKYNIQSSRFKKYEGKSHAQGGINTGSLEVEGGETEANGYIYSDRIRNNSGLSVAELSEMIAKKYKNKRHTTSGLSRISMKNEMKDLSNYAERLKLRSGTGYSNEQAMYGGYRKKMYTGGYRDQYHGVPQDMNGQSSLVDPLKIGLDSKPMQTLSSNVNTNLTLPTPEKRWGVEGQFISTNKIEPLALPDVRIPNLPTPNSYDGGVQPSRLDKIGAYLNNNADNLGIAASMTPAILSSVKDLTRSPERAKLYQNNERYNVLDLMRNNRIDDDALTNQAIRSNTGARVRMGARSASVQNAYNLSLGNRLNQDLQNIQFQTQTNNNQYRTQEAQTRASLGSEDRGYRHQQYVEQSQNDANTRNLARNASQNIFNLIGSNINSKQMHEQLLANQKDIATLNAVEKLSLLNNISSTFGISDDYAKSLLHYIQSGDTESFQNLLNQMKKGSITTK